jgi:hypothetical protein
MEEAKGIIIEDLWKRHENGYDHNGGASLLTYAWPYLAPLIHETLSQYRHYGKHGNTLVVPAADVDGDGALSLDGLQAMALDQGRNRLYLEPLYESPIPGLRPELEQGIPSEEEKLARWLMERLTPEELAVLDASDRSDAKASSFLKEAGFPMSKTTYWRKLKDARAKAKDLARGFARS